MMALGHKVNGSGLNYLAVASLCSDVEAGLTATGTTQGTAYALTAAISEFTTVAVNTGAVLYAGTPGDSQLVYNGGVNTLKVYPPSGSKINALATDAAYSIAVNTGCEYSCVSSTRWIGIISA